MGTMEEMLASVADMTFNLEKTLDMQLGLQALPFPGMDKSGAAVCTFFLQNSCGKGTNCPYRHIKGDKSVVCKHWLRGLCKKGDDCEFLHEYDMERMPECYFYSRFGECGNKDCPFLHIEPEMKIKACPWFDRGFCRHGNLCKNKHVRRVLCSNYLSGFCLDGATCPYLHPSFELPISDAMGANPRKPPLTCHNCGEVGHKAIVCPQLFNSRREHHHATSAGHGEGRSKAELRPLDQVTCFKCCEKGHYANKCPSSYHGNFRKPLSQKQPYNNQQQQNHQQYNNHQQPQYNNNNPPQQQNCNNQPQQQNYSNNQQHQHYNNADHNDNTFNNQ